MAELNYSPVEKLCLALYFAATKLRHYMLPSVVQIISKTDLIKYMLTRPIIRGRIGKWTMALSEFTFQYVAQRSVKGQALADFLAHHPTQGQEGETEVEIGMARMEKNYWTMYFDGSSTESRSGAGVVIESPQGQRWQFAFQLDFRCTNNQAEYEALIIGLEILQGMKATRVLVYGDSQLVINQLTGDYQCTSENLAMYYVTALNTADQFSRISFVHVPRAKNHEANEMAQVASGVSIPADDLDRVIRIEKRTLPALAERGMTTQMASVDVSDEVETADTDWRYPMVKYLPHQSGIKMRWLVRRHGYYWPSILKDCIEYAKACIKCQIYGPIQRVPAEALHPVTKPWPFRGWAVDIIGKIYPAASNQHAWILVATDYFTKWLIHSTPYYPQSNGQAEASNKVIKGIL
ncbi:unnamed protein product [Prunus brigantina]